MSCKLETYAKRNSGSFGDWQETGTTAQCKAEVTKGIMVGAKLSGRSQEPTDVFQIVGPDAGKLKEEGRDKPYKGGAEGKNRDQLKQANATLSYKLSGTKEEEGGKTKKTAHKLHVVGGVIQPYSLGDKPNIKALITPYKQAAPTDDRRLGGALLWTFEKTEQKTGDNGEKLGPKKVKERAYVQASLAEANTKGVMFVKETKVKDGVSETKTTWRSDLEDSERDLAITLGAGYLFPVEDWTLDLRGLFNQNNLEEKGETSAILSAAAKTKFFKRSPSELQLDFGLQYALIDPNATYNGAEIEEAQDITLFAGVSHVVGRHFLPEKYAKLLQVNAQVSLARADIPGYFDFTPDGGGISSDSSDLYGASIPVGVHDTYLTAFATFSLSGDLYQNPDQSGLYFKWAFRAFIGSSELTGSTDPSTLANANPAPYLANGYGEIKMGWKF
jgi:hypothetical protein